MFSFGRFCTPTAHDYTQKVMKKELLVDMLTKKLLIVAPGSVSQLSLRASRVLPMFAVRRVLVFRCTRPGSTCLLTFCPTVGRSRDARLQGEFRKLRGCRGRAPLDDAFGSESCTSACSLPRNRTTSARSRVSVEPHRAAGRTQPGASSDRRQRAFWGCKIHQTATCSVLVKRQGAETNLNIQQEELNCPT